MSSQVNNGQKPTIYLNDKYLNMAIEKIPQNVKSSDRVGDVWARMSVIYKSNNPALKKDLVPLLSRLGVSETDRRAHDTLIPLVGKVLTDGVRKIAPVQGNAFSGVYLMDDDVAVFKVGPRACMETFARRFGEKFDLPNVIPGLYCTIANPEFPEAEMPVDLYNGNELVYEYQDGAGKTLTGIFEPFMPSKAFVKEGEKMSHRQFLHAALLAILLGAEDIKEDGITEDLFFDIEKVMRPQPKPHEKVGYNKSVPTIHLPFIDCDMGRQKISKEILKELLTKIKAVKLPKLYQELSNERIMYPDLIAESAEAAEISDNESDEDSINALYPKFKDEGNCLGFVRPPFEKNKRTIKIDPEDEDSFALFNDSQILGCMSRMNLLREFITECIKNGIEPNAIDLMKAADPLYSAQYENFATTKANKRREASPVPFIGNTSPSSWGGKLDKAVIEEVQRSYSRSSSPQDPDEECFLERPLSVSFSSTDELVKFLRSTPRSESGNNSSNPFTRKEEKKED